ncbi:hypothetical protein DL95DRAFT_462877 [Leptodontidium sp. 2 PMI_412]|nr:hypothetical protein DL95DRAFT_462877 [Leptodontidium sp. 2 PMI_412]
MASEHPPKRVPVDSRRSTDALDSQSRQRASSRAQTRKTRILKPARNYSRILKSARPDTRSKLKSVIMKAAEDGEIDLEMPATEKFVPTNTNTAYPEPPPMTDEEMREMLGEDYISDDEDDYDFGNDCIDLLPLTICNGLGLDYWLITTAPGYKGWKYPGLLKDLEDSRLDTPQRWVDE